MKLNKLKIWVIPPRPFPSQAVFGIRPAAFLLLWLLSHSSVPPLRRGQCPPKAQVVCSTAGGGGAGGEKSELPDSVFRTVLWPVTALAAGPEAEELLQGQKRRGRQHAPTSGVQRQG